MGGSGPRGRGYLAGAHFRGRQVRNPHPEELKMDTWKEAW